LEADELLESSPALHFVTGVSSLAVAPREERHIEETAEYKLNLQL
jgi:hypothetical protein